MDLYERMRARVQTHAAKPTNWYEIRNDADSSVVRIYDEIGFWGVTAADFARDLEAIASPKIEVQINSPGGNVFDGIAIYNTLRTHPAKITTRVDGLAASAASVIAQAGDRRVMVQASQMMIHEAWGAAIGPADELREFADLLDQQNDVLASIYATRAHKPAEEFRALMAAETWLTDQAAVDLGLADEVFNPEPADAENAAWQMVNGLMRITDIAAPEPPAPASKYVDRLRALDLDELEIEAAARSLI